MTAMSSSRVYGRQMGRNDESSYAMPKLTILIVDDSRFARTIIKNSLCSFSFIQEIIEVGDAVEGLKFIKSGDEPIDLILLDNEMPLLTGEEFTLTVRRDADFPEPEIPIIMVSSHIDQPRVVAARNAGINEFLAKPFSAKDLYQRICSTILNPRPFIRTKDYVGPDRRWIKRKYKSDRRDQVSAAPPRVRQKKAVGAQ